MGKHALLSASSSHRWLNCPPSARLCEKMCIRDRSCVVHSETLYKALCSLPEKQRKVLLFDFWYAWTDREIAARMEVTTRTVYNLRQRAFKAIRKFYEQGSSEP